MAGLNHENDKPTGRFLVTNDILLDLNDGFLNKFFPFLTLYCKGLYGYANNNAIVEISKRST